MKEIDTKSESFIINSAFYKYILCRKGDLVDQSHSDQTVCMYEVVTYNSHVISPWNS